MEYGGSGGSLLAYADANSSSGVHALAPPEEVSKKKKVVVIGTGWAGTSFLKKLNNPSYDVQVISPRNYFAFTPLLPSVTCGTVEARSIVEPIRNIVRKVMKDHHSKMASDQLLKWQLYNSPLALMVPPSLKLSPNFLLFKNGSM